MSAHITFRALEPALGVILIALVLFDVFLTVLYARIGTGIISTQLARATWRLFRWGSRPFGQNRPTLLSICGPVIVVELVGVWALMLTCGTALIFHPYLGKSIFANTGQTPTDFISAVYASAGSMAIVGSNDFVPKTSIFRALYLFTSLAGITVVTLTLTYLMQIYAGLQRRNTLGLNLHLLTYQTGDAAELLAALGPEGHFNAGYANLTELAQLMTEVKESHHFYPVLFYFRFPEAYYSVSRSTFVALDTVALLKTALANDRYEWLKGSASVSQLWQASLLTVETLEKTFVPGGLPDRDEPPQEVERWHRRYFAALRRLRNAGIPTIEDPEAGVEAYVSLRMRWDAYIAKLAANMGYTSMEIDPAGHHTPRGHLQPGAAAGFP